MSDNQIITGYRIRPFESLTFCDDESIDEVMQVLADDIKRAKRKGEFIQSVEFDWGLPLADITYGEDE